MMKSTAVLLTGLLFASLSFAQTPSPLLKTSPTSPSSSSSSTPSITASATSTPLAHTMVPAPSCETKAVGKNGKPLSGAAKTAFVSKCEKDTTSQTIPVDAKAKTDMKATPVAAPASVCEIKAVGKNGKPLSGAAKTASITKCEKDAKSSIAVETNPPVKK